MDKIEPPHYCLGVKQAIESEDKIIEYNDQYREYGIPIRDGGSSYLVIKYCPFCGAELPSSLREEWFKALEKEGTELLSPDDVPEHMRSGMWWRDLTR